MKIYNKLFDNLMMNCRNTPKCDLVCYDLSKIYRVLNNEQKEKFKSLLYDKGINVEKL